MLSKNDIAQLTSGSVVPPTDSYRVPSGLTHMPDSQRKAVAEFIRPFVIREDSTKHLYRMCIEIGLLNLPKPGKYKHCGQTAFYNIARQVRREVGIVARKTREIDMFHRLHPYCKRAAIIKILEISGPRFDWMANRYPLKSLRLQPIKEYVVGLNINESLVKKLLDHNESVDEIVSKALNDYFNKGGKNES